MSRREQWIVTAWVVVAGLVLAFGAKRSPGGSVKVPAASTEDVPVFTPPPGVPDPTPHHIGPYNLIYTPHRYPAACGQEISVLIHRGYHTMALPHENDMTWLSAPPGEAVL